MKHVNGKFDSAAYYNEYPDVKSAGVDAAHHWAKNGIKEGRKGFITEYPLGGYFDADGYLECNPDVKNAGLPALSHYEKHGCRENRRICLNIEVVSDPTGVWGEIAKAGKAF